MVMRELSRILSALIGIASIFVAGLFIDGTVNVLTDWETFSLREYWVTDSFFYLLVGLILFCLISILNKLAIYFSVILEGSFNFKADLDILKKISKTNLQEVEEKNFQDLINYVPQYSRTSFIEAYNHLSLALIQFITMVSSVIMLSRVVGWWSLLIVLFVLPETISQFVRNEQIREYVDKSIGKIKFMNYIRLISTRVPDFPELRVTGVFKHLKRTFRDKGQTYYSGLFNRNFHLYSDQALFSVTGQIILTGYIIYILAVSVVQGITIGSFSALVNYARTGYNAAYHFINHLFHLFNELLYVNSFFELLDYKGFGDLPTGDAKLSKGCPTVEFKHLTFSYPKTKERVLDDISLKIEPGEKVAFVGSSGSGKSSIVRILCGLFKITSGDYMINGYSVREIGRGELKNKIAVIFQDFVRYNFSLKRNIVIGSSSSKINNHLYDRVKKIAMVDDFMKRLDISDSQFLGKFFGTGKELSPGHWQKLAIARMLYRNKEIMVMDEPFTFIDGFSKSKILDGIIEFVGEKKILIYITQDTDHLQKFNRVYYLKNGRIVEEGAAKDLIKKKGKFYKEVKYNC
jgi:ABC-type multidrug transport system fused ATPase/permease subunit